MENNMDKIKKIKEWISKKQDGLMDTNGNFKTAADEASYNTLCNLDAYIDILQKEPVSEDLEEAASRYAKEEYSRKSPATLPDRCRGCYAPLMYAFKAGAEWQITKLVEETGKHEVKVDAGGYPYIPQIEIYDYDKDIPLAKEGDKYKVILIKEG